MTKFGLVHAVMFKRESEDNTNIIPHFPLCVATLRGNACATRLLADKS